MNNIPLKLRSRLAVNPFYRCCARASIADHMCDGRITWEHAYIFAGRQVQKEWAIVPLCAKAHSVDDWQDCGDLNKEVNRWIALNRATDEDLAEVSKAVDYRRERDRLNAKYGVYRSRLETSINY